LLRPAPGGPHERRTRFKSLLLGGSVAHAVDQGENDDMAAAMGNPDPVPGLDPNEPIPDTPAELDEPEALPDPPIESTPEDPGGDPSGEPAPA
jgi:hypothetical protein